MPSLRCHISENSQFTPAVFHCQGVVKYIQLRYDGETSSAQRIFVGKPVGKQRKQDTECMMIAQ